MADKEIITIDSMPSLALMLDTDVVTNDYYVLHYAEYLPMYAGHGNPSEDTLATYTQSIDLFLRWCRENRLPPLKAKDKHMRAYFEVLRRRGLHKNTLATRLTGVRMFFTIAKKLELIEVNPCADLHFGPQNSNDALFRYYEPAQIQELVNAFSEEPDEFIRLRNTLILLLMAVEGLRNVEVVRMNDQDIQWDNPRSILIHGKGHDAPIFPSDVTFNVLAKYLQVRPPALMENGLTPTIINDNNHGHSRMSRNGIRFIMNKALESCHLKVKGFSCHIFRHSCGTNLYESTKDIRLVQEQLRHSDPKITARYAHVHNRISQRYTNKIAPDVKV